MAQISFANSVISSLFIVPSDSLLDFIDLKFRTPSNGTNDPNFETIMNDGADGGFPGNQRDIAFVTSTDLLSVTCISIKKLSDGTTDEWETHVQSPVNPTVPFWNRFKELVRPYGEQTTGTLYIDDDI
jgi:hypothetical protein